jgi:carboxypeptidase Q
MRQARRRLGNAAVVLVVAVIAGALVHTVAALQAQQGVTQRIDPPVLPPPAGLAELLAAARTDALIMARLADLTDDIGARFAGSEALARAVSWGERTLREDGHENVHREPITVPRWVRGSERLEMVAPQGKPLLVLGLGGSVGTPGIEAPVSVVHSFEELSPAVAGTVVLFCARPRPGDSAGANYGANVKYRAQGAAKAAACGAVAVLIRSVTVRSLHTPHTGSMSYDDTVPAIPAAAITSEDAEWIDRLAARGIGVRVRLEMGAQMLPDVPSHNVLAEIVGSERPEEIVLVGGHLDSWDVGQGAQDDGAGILHTIETLRLIRTLGLKPRRTIRAVLFVNEEFGLNGGLAYEAAHGADCHVAAIETDLGSGQPLTWSASGSAYDLAWLRRTALPLGLPVEGSGSGADISPLERQGVLCVGLRPDLEAYFDVHHTDADTYDKVDPALLREGTAVVAGLTWLLANEAR